jgi:hypothetical protein
MERQTDLQFLNIGAPITTDGSYGPAVMAGECFVIAKPSYNEEM